jgi:hypothetical protein
MRCIAAGKNIEVARLQFENHCPSDSRFLPRCSPNFFGKASYQRFRFRQRDIALERVFGGYRFGRSVGNDLRVINAAGSFIQALAEPAKVPFECSRFQPAQMLHRLDSKLLKSPFGHLADAWQTRDWQRR